MSKRLGAVAVLLILVGLGLLAVQQRVVHQDVRALLQQAKRPAPPSSSPAAATLSDVPWDQDFYGAADAAEFWWAAQVSHVRSAAQPWEAPGFDGASMAGYGPAHFTCADGEDGRLDVSAGSTRAQCEGVASNGSSGYGTIIAVELSRVGSVWRISAARAAGDAG